MLGIWPRTESQAKKTSGCGDQLLSALKCASSRRCEATAGGWETWEAPPKFLPAFVLTLLLFPSSFFFSSPFPALNCLSSNECKAWITLRHWGWAGLKLQHRRSHGGVGRRTFPVGNLAGLTCGDLGLGLGLHPKRGNRGPARQGSWG